MYATITLIGEGLQDLQVIKSTGKVLNQVRVDAKTARRKATGWLVSEVGNLLMGGEPILTIGEKPIWQVPALLTSTRVGIVGEVGIVEVDAETGQLYISEILKAKILHNAENLPDPSPSTNR